LTKPIKQDALLQAINEHSIAVQPLSNEESSRKVPLMKRATSIIAELTPEFLQNRRQDVITMLGALNRGDFETVASLGHGMKGAGGSYGFQTITDIGGALAQAAQS